MTHRFLSKYCCAKHIFKISNSADLAHFSYNNECGSITKLTTAILKLKKTIIIKIKINKTKINKNIIYAPTCFLVNVSYFNVFRVYGFKLSPGIQRHQNNARETYKVSYFSTRSI